MLFWTHVIQDKLKTRDADKSLVWDDLTLVFDFASLNFGRIVLIMIWAETYKNEVLGWDSIFIPYILVGGHTYYKIIKKNLVRGHTYYKIIKNKERKEERKK